MGFFTVLITAVLLAIGFIAGGLWHIEVTKQNNLERNIAYREAKTFFNKVEGIYSRYYATIHMINYFHYLCNQDDTNNYVIANDLYQNFFYDKEQTCSAIAADDAKKFRYRNIILFSNGTMCRAYLDSNNSVSIAFNTCKSLKDWYKDSIITNIDYGILKSFIPPDTDTMNKKIALFIKGTAPFPANSYTYVPYLEMMGILYKVEGKNKYVLLNYFPINTFKTVANRVKAANNILDTYSYYIRAYAKKIYKQTNYNPYVFKYTLGSLLYNSSTSKYQKKAVFLPGVNYYGLDTSLLVSLPNIYTYTKINGYVLPDGSGGNPLASLPSPDLYEPLRQESVGMSSPYREDNIVNLDSANKLYAMQNAYPNMLKSYDPSEWNTNTDNILFALLRLGKNCKAKDFNNVGCDKYIWYSTDLKITPTSLSPSIFKYLYVNLYENAYQITNFKYFNQYGAVDLNVTVDPSTGEKKAEVDLRTINDFFIDNFHLNLSKICSQRGNPFFGDFIYYPDTTYMPDELKLGLLVDNVSNVNYPSSTIDESTVSIFSNYSISFAIPYVYDAFDTNTFKKSLIPGLFVKMYSIVVVQ